MSLIHQPYQKEINTVKGESRDATKINFLENSCKAFSTQQDLLTVDNALNGICFFILPRTAVKILGFRIQIRDFSDDLKNVHSSDFLVLHGPADEENNTKQIRADYVQETKVELADKLSVDTKYTTALFLKEPFQISPSMTPKYFICIESSYVSYGTPSSVESAGMELGTNEHMTIIAGESVDSERKFYSFRKFAGIIFYQVQNHMFSAAKLSTEGFKDITLEFKW